MAVACVKARSVYELGCGPGPSLRLLRETMPDLKLGGCDIRPAYVEWCLQHGLYAEVATCPQPVKPEWDATLSCYVMAYLDKELTIEQLSVIQSRSLILMEPQGHGECTANIAGLNKICAPRFYHNWRELLRVTGWEMIWRWPVSQADDLSTLVIAVRA